MDKLNVTVPSKLDVVWALVKPRSNLTVVKKILVCSFYSPPCRGANPKMTDYLITTLQMLVTQHPESGIMMGADRKR